MFSGPSASSWRVIFYRPGSWSFPPAAARSARIWLATVSLTSVKPRHTRLQHNALTGAGCGRIYTEKVSTRKAAAERRGLAAALDYLRPGDTLVVWKLDRLGRSVREVLTIADDLHARSIGVRILTGKLSGSYSPRGEGKFFFTMMAAFAELERDIIHERTMAGLAAARAQGHARRAAHRDGLELLQLRRAANRVLTRVVSVAVTALCSRLGWWSPSPRSAATPASTPCGSIPSPLTRTSLPTLDHLTVDR